jgi:ubiquinone/menaquinone biosynthesis C-methylase UbiE
MSSFVWMKVLESAPERYDRGIHMLSGGRIEEAYERIAAVVATPGKRVLDIGCGTGGASFACAARGAVVIGIDINAGMLEVARKKAPVVSGRVEFLELGAAEIEDCFAADSFDAVVSCLAMSEMSQDEQNYALRAAYRCLVRGGALVIADETVPENGLTRLLYRLQRLPVAAAAYLLTQTTTRPVSGLCQRVRAAEFRVVDVNRMWSGSFLVIHAVKEKS